MRIISEEHKQRVTNKIIVFTENKKTIRLKNPDQDEYIKVHIDGEAIKEGERCDYKQEFYKKFSAKLEVKSRQLEISLKK